MRFTTPNKAVDAYVQGWYCHATCMCRILCWAYSKRHHYCEKRFDLIGVLQRARGGGLLQSDGFHAARLGLSAYDDYSSLCQNREKNRLEDSDLR